MSINKKQIEALGFTGWGFGDGDGSLWFMRSEDKKVEIVKTPLGDVNDNYFVKNMIHLVLFDDRVEFTQNFTQILRTCAPTQEAIKENLAVYEGFVKEWE